MSMSTRYNQPFQPIRNSSETSFVTTLGTTTQGYSLGNSSARVWQGPDGRSIRICSTYSTATYYLAFGTTSTLTTAFSSGPSMVLFGGQTYVFALEPGDNAIAIASSTSVTAWVTLGYGGA